MPLSPSVSLLDRRPAKPRAGERAQSGGGAHAFADGLQEAFRQFDDASILITGGTGSFGRRFIETLLRHGRARRLIVFSRDEFKQYEMQQQLAGLPGETLRFFIGDVRDGDRLEMAMREVDFVIHAAALKQVPAAEYNPFECIRTNVSGAENVVRAALAQRRQEGARALHRQGRQPDQPLRRQQARLRQDLRRRQQPHRHRSAPASRWCATATWSARAAASFRSSASWSPRAPTICRSPTSA